MIDHPAPPVPGKSPRYAARVFVLAKLAVLRARVLAGHSLRHIYALEGADTVMGYRQFVRYVERYLPAESRIQRWSAQREEPPAPPGAFASVAVQPASLPQPIPAPAAPVIPAQRDIQHGTPDPKSLSRGSSYRGNFYNPGRPAKEILRERHGRTPDNDK
jgi:hypothetical protein